MGEFKYCLTCRKKYKNDGVITICPTCKGTLSDTPKAKTENVAQKRPVPTPVPIPTEDTAKTDKKGNTPKPIPTETTTSGSKISGGRIAKCLGYLIGTGIPVLGIILWFVFYFKHFAEEDISANCKIAMLVLNIVSTILFVISFVTLFNQLGMNPVG